MEEQDGIASYSSAISSSQSPAPFPRKHARKASIPLRVRAVTVGDVPRGGPSTSTTTTTILSPSSADIPSAYPSHFSASPSDESLSDKGRPIHAALPQKASEKYGFVVYVGSAIAWNLYLFWAFTADKYIKALGIEWYPDREWAILVPAWIMMAVVYVYIAYFALNIYHTPSLASMTTMSDAQGRLHPRFLPASQQPITIPPISISNLGPEYEADYIPPLYDLPVEVINEAVFGSSSQH